MGNVIAINEIWKYTTLDFPTNFVVIWPKSDRPKSAAIEFKFISRVLGLINTHHWFVLDQRMIAAIKPAIWVLWLEFWEIYVWIWI